MNTTEAIILAVRSVPEGQVSTYARIAEAAGISNGARQVARILHTCSDKYDLPWWRIVRSNGEIALTDESGGRLQKELLLQEGVFFTSSRVVDMDRCGV